MIDGDFYKELGAKIRDLRKQAKMTQDDVAERIGIHRSELSAFESRGEQIRSAEKINKILSCLGYELHISEKKTSLMCA